MLSCDSSKGCEASWLHLFELLLHATSGGGVTLSKLPIQATYTDIHDWLESLWLIGEVESMPPVPHRQQSHILLCWAYWKLCLWFSQLYKIKTYQRDSVPTVGKKRITFLLYKTLVYCRFSVWLKTFSFLVINLHTVIHNIFKKWKCFWKFVQIY